MCTPSPSLCQPTLEGRSSTADYSCKNTNILAKMSGISGEEYKEIR